MNIDFTGVARLDTTKHYTPIIVLECRGREISRVRERGHAPYRCTRGFISANKMKGASDKMQEN